MNLDKPAGLKPNPEGSIRKSRGEFGFLGNQRIWPVPACGACLLAVLLLLVCDCSATQAADRNPGQVDYMAHSPPVVQPLPEPTNVILEGLLFVAVVVLAFRAAAPILARRNISIQKTAEAREFLDRFCENEPSLIAFFEALKEIRLPHVGAIAASQETSQTGEDKLRAEPDSAQKFIEWSQSQVETLGKLFAEASRTTEVATRQKLLLKLSDLMGSFKERCSMPELKPLWRLAYALEVLLKQLARNENLISASALKTVAGALDLVQVLSLEEVSPNVAADAPIQVLAVDDDPVSLCALSLALQKVFDPPDTAPDGHKGLALAAEQAYDIIFLDVEMPGMDGFELCMKVRQTAANRATPIVFVTRHSDFNSRAKTAVSGGNELIGKPFLALEIAVKALTLVLGSRQRNNPANLEPAETRSDPPALLKPADRSNDFEEAASDDISPGSQLAEWRSSQTIQAGAVPVKVDGGREFDAEHSVSLSYGRSDDEKSNIEKLRSGVEAAMRARDAPVRQEILGQLYVGVHELSVETERDGLNAAHRLSAALEDLLRKLLEQPAACRSCVLDAADDALHLLGELRAFGEDVDFFEGSFRILVVDDDPIARRAVAGSLQLVFGKPECAESGEAAVDLAAETAFDLIFLDVMMPGMDGFQTCMKIHQTEANRETPILFVTSNDDAVSRRQAFGVGGSGFIAKPVLPKEILLRTLTLTLRGKRRMAQPVYAI